MGPMRPADIATLGALIVVWLVTVGAPIGGLLLASGEAPGVDAAPLESPGGDAWTLAVRSSMWAGATAMLAGVLGWRAGRWLGAAGRGRRGAWIAVLAPIAAPAYVMFWLWWQSVPPDSALAAWAARTGRTTLLREGLLAASLVGWCWPIVAWTVAAHRAGRGGTDEALLGLDGARGVTRWRQEARADATPLGLGMLFVFIVTLGNTTAFDLAQVYTTGNQLRFLRDQGGAGATLVGAAGPTLLVLGLAMLAAWGLAGRGERRARDTPATARSLDGVIGAMIWAAAVIVPVVVLIVRWPAWSAVGQFVDFYGRDFVNTFTLAAITGFIGAAATVGLAWRAAGRTRGATWLMRGFAAGWCVTAVLPATLISTGLEAAFNRPGLGWVYGSASIVGVGLLGRFLIVAAFFGRGAASSESRSVRDSRRLDGGDGFVSYVQSMGTSVGSPLIAGSVAAGATMLTLGMSEIHVTAQVQPPAFRALAGGVLNAMHYQRPDTVILATAFVMGLAIVAATAIATALCVRGRVGGRTGWAAMVALVAILAPGCSDGPGEPGGRLEPTLVFGANGSGLGQFFYPRGIAVDAEREYVYVVDKTARVQRFGFDGMPQLAWSMPAKENGKPTGLNVAPDGRVFVADTHYWRIIAFDPEGREVMRFGGYGEGPGEFIYPTDIEFGADGTIYVSEYGGNDRVQAFTPEGEYLFEFGSLGEGREEFLRPQSMAFSRDRSELFIADSCNHRIVVVDPRGEVQRILGGQTDQGPGPLRYPYDVDVLADGSLLISEFGGNRIQQLDPTDGRSLGTWGVLGAARGELKYPWGVDGAGGRTFVLDSGNHRVQVIATPR